MPGISPLLMTGALGEAGKARAAFPSPFAAGLYRHRVSLDEGSESYPRASTKDSGFSSTRDIASPADREGRSSDTSALGFCNFASPWLRVFPLTSLPWLAHLAGK